MSLTLNAGVSEIGSPRRASIDRGLSLEGDLWAASEFELVKFSMVTSCQRRRIRAQFRQQSSCICHVINPECRRG